MSQGTAPPLSDGAIFLTSFELGDIEAHLAGEDEEQARRFGWYPARSTHETVRAAIERWQQEWRTDGARLAWALRDGEGVLAGGCELRLKEDGQAEISYWVFPQYRGRGWAARAVELAARYAFEYLGVQRIEACVEPDNWASRRTVERAGFMQERVLVGHERVGDQWRDMVLYARNGEPEP